jgi:RNA polymerase sigma factor (sigma-70 family)
VSEQLANLDELSDAEIVARFQAAERDEAGNVWVQELFRRYYAKVVTWCLRIAGDRDDAADLAQGIFVRVQRHLGSFRGDSKFSTWLYSIARSECMNYVKKSRSSSQRTPADDDELGELPDVGRSAPDEMLDRERSARTVRAMLERELDDTEKKVFTLHYGDDVSLDAITRLLGLQNRSGAKAYIVSARRKLARAVERLRAGELRLNA